MGGLGDGTQVKVNSSTCQKLYFLRFSVAPSELNLRNLSFYFCVIITIPISPHSWFKNHDPPLGNLSRELINRELLVTKWRRQAARAHRLICHLPILLQLPGAWIPPDRSPRDDLTFHTVRPEGTREHPLRSSFPRDWGGFVFRPKKPTQKHSVPPAPPSAGARGKSIRQEAHGILQLQLSAEASWSCTLERQ